MVTTIYTKWGNDIVAVSADWSQASCSVEGDAHGRQVADFCHSPEDALEAALVDCAIYDGLDQSEMEEYIREAMENAVHSEEYIAKYHERD